jgi:hypothetical protein
LLFDVSGIYQFHSPNLSRQGMPDQFANIHAPLVSGDQAEAIVVGKVTSAGFAHAVDCGAILA